VLRALQEAGVKIDLVAGHGVGAATAVLASIDGGSRLWEAKGLWRSATPRAFYGWRPLLVATGWIAAVLVLVLLTPLVVLLASVVVYLAGFLLTLLGITAGGALITSYSVALQHAFAGENLPTTVPRLAMVVLGILVLVAFAGVAVAHGRAPVKRRAQGSWWWRLLGAPLDAARTRDAFAAALWQLIRGAAAADRPARTALGRRFAEVLSENLGQPGFRELLMVVTDLDSRRDVVAALLRDPFRRDFLAPRPGHDRRAEVLDLTGVGRDHAFDVVAAALTPPLACEPACVTFAADSFWRGETHRLCDRPAAASRVLEEVAAAGVSQVVIVSAVPLGVAPHALSAPRLDLRNRLGEYLAAAECAALRDAIGLARLRFESIYVVSPDHNPIGPFDFAGAYDEASDRHQDLTELMERGYEDGYRQFIEPVVGASGELLAHVATAPGAALPGGVAGLTADRMAHDDRLFDDPDVSDEGL
jgi:hypothetical protein